MITTKIIVFKSNLIFRHYDTNYEKKRNPTKLVKPTYENCDMGCVICIAYAMVNLKCRKLRFLVYKGVNAYYSLWL